MSTEHASSEEELTYEKSDVSVFYIIIFSVLVVGFIAGCVVFLDSWFVRTREQTIQEYNNYEQSNLQTREAAASAQLNSYGVSKVGDGYRIPIDDAMKKVVDEAHHR